MISLVKFKDYLSGSGGKSSPTVSIKAKDLDGNFSALTPLPDKFGIMNPVFEKNGYSFSFKAGNMNVVFREIDICVNGTAKKMMVLGTDPY